MKSRRGANSAEVIDVFPYYFKPKTPVVLNSEKLSFQSRVSIPTFVLRKKEPVIMFHPQLPYNLMLYFKDRQQVHIELTFQILSSGPVNSITVKRKISSGNLEADLLSMRYINRYLFLQQTRFTLNKWQTVKIDLGPKND